jgi:hypothetical protein
MFRRLNEHLKSLYQQLSGMSRDLGDLSHKLDLIERDLLLRDPGSAKAADAYEGLRKQVVAAVSERQAHLAHLAHLDAALHRGESAEELQLLVGEFLQQAGLLRIDDPRHPEAYEVVDGDGENLVVLAPAYVDATTARLVRQGRARAEAQAPDHSLMDFEQTTEAVIG